MSIISVYQNMTYITRKKNYFQEDQISKFFPPFQINGFGNDLNNFGSEKSSRIENKSKIFNFSQEKLSQKKDKFAKFTSTTFIFFLNALMFVLNAVINSS